MVCKQSRRPTKARACSRHKNTAARQEDEFLLCLAQPPKGRGDSRGSAHLGKLVTSPRLQNTASCRTPPQLYRTVGYTAAPGTTGAAASAPTSRQRSSSTKGISHPATRPPAPQEPLPPASALTEPGSGGTAAWPGSTPGSGPSRRCCSSCSPQTPWPEATETGTTPSVTWISWHRLPRCPRVLSTSSAQGACLEPQPNEY